MNGVLTASLLRQREIEEANQLRLKQSCGCRGPAPATKRALSLLDQNRAANPETPYNPNVRTPSVFTADTAYGATAQNIGLGFYDNFITPQRRQLGSGGGIGLGADASVKTFGNMVACIFNLNQTPYPRGPGRTPSLFTCVTDRCAAAEKVELGFQENLPTPSYACSRGGGAALGGSAPTTYANLCVQHRFRGRLR
jgi:hypothetical protein